MQGMTPIQPRTIQPGYLWRWTKTGLSLLGVNFHLWFAFSLLFCGVCYLLSPLYFLRLLAGIPFVAFSMSMASYSTKRAVSLSELKEVLSGSFARARDELVHMGRHLFILGIVVTGLDVMTLFRHAASGKTPHAVDYHELSTWVFYDSPFQWGLMGLLAALTVLARGTGFGTVLHSLTQHFGISLEEARIPYLQAVNRNLEVGFKLMAVEFSVLLVCACMIPIVAPLLLCLVPAMHHVMFLELFDPNGLPSESTQEQHSAAHAPAPSGG